MNKKIWSGTLLLLVIIMALAVRIWGVGFGLPDLIHTDEARIILDSMSMAQRMSLLSEDVNYPLFTKYLLTLSYGLFYAGGRITGIFSDKVDFAVGFLSNPSSIIMLSRIVMAIMGTIGVIIAYFWGKLIDGSKRTGLIAALFVAVEWQLVLENQYALHQTLAALTSLFVFFGICLLCVYSNRKAYIVAGISLGLAVASHHTTVLVLPGFAYLLFIELLDKKISRRTLFKNWASLISLAIIIGILGNLNFIFQFQRSFGFFVQGSGAAKVAFSSAPFFSYDLPSIVVWYVAEFIRRNYFVGFFVAAGLAMAVFKRKRLDILYLILCLTYFIFFKNWAFRWMHLFVGLIPISLLFGARFFSRLGEKYRLSNPTMAILVVLVVIPNIVDIVKMNLAKQNIETRQEAKVWIEKNVPAGTKIAVDYPAHAVPIPSRYPLMLRNRVAMNYFDTAVPTIIKDRYFEQLSQSPTHEVTDMLRSEPSPVWPDDMPAEAVQQAENQATMRDLYSYFNFRPITELKSSGVKYLVITSYTYGMFLFNSDPSKEFLANTYIKDDIIPFFYHEREISKGTQHELMYYVAKRGRDYFSPILENRISGLALVKEFRPDSNHFGPVVKIYSFSSAQ